MHVPHHSRARLWASVPLRLAALLGNQPRAYCWSGRVWVASVHVVFAMTIGGAYDGTGVALADRMCTPFGLAAAVGLGFGVGAQGALLSVPRDIATNMGVTLLVIAAIKLHVVYMHTYLALHVASLSSLALGYVVVSKHADVHEAIREAADAVLVCAAAREPFVVTDATLHILAVNQRLLDVLGYEDHELMGRPVTELVTEGAGLGRTLFEATSRSKCPNGHVWTVLAKDGRAHPVRITLGETHCLVNGTKMFTGMFSCMRLEQRNAQLHAEKERLQWEVASHHDGSWEDPRERLGATVVKVKLECHADDCPLFDQDPHRTLGAMQDQATTDAAVSCANSFDHVNLMNTSPNVPRCTLVAPAPPRTASPLTSIDSCRSSVMDTISQAAKKSPTRAPPPPKKESRLRRPKKVCSEPSSAPKPETGNAKKSKRVIPPIERVADT